jgi:AcrR family transcriptional regulator
MLEVFLTKEQRIKVCSACKFGRMVAGVTDLETQSLGRRDRKKQQTRAALIAAALRLVDERGFERVTVEEISEAADVSSRTFFNYFATKDDAVIGDPLVGGAELRERLLAVTPGIPIIGALLLAMAPAIAQIEADRELWGVRLRVLNNNPMLLPVLFARGTAAESEFVAAIAARARVGVDHLYPQLAASVTGAAFRTSMLRWAAGDGGRPLSELVNEAFGMLAAGLTDPAPTNEED